MTVESLGMIEVKGFLGAVVAADAALKAADVEMRDLRITRGGLVTVLLTGDVAAVNAGVDAGVASIEQFDCLISEHVIARMDGQTNTMVQPPSPEPTPNESDEPQAPEDNDAATSDDVVTPKPSVETPAKPVEQPAAPAETTAKLPSDWATDRTTLEKMRVVDLRKQAYRMNIQTLTKKQIKMGNKRTLVQAILDDLQRRNNS
ncbi:BMC domain-containing protein [Levilactobacillus angrenensis]|uniref:BMC domain-containing protein n=1 Tax=Levilactobacillus angrenensis TaxID=2486020 RepID=A0ABW1UDQ4_9LACO|nr:BMC domain-containing protein [Levilactobacillus angrenensis]